MTSITFSKVYVIDNRSLQESLLRNGIVDIKLIDAWCSNMDHFRPPRCFPSEEIDLIVFVVNAENHFTLSAKEFIAAAAAEKRYVFIVVNKFDNASKDKNKGMNKVLEQVKNLSPDTCKDAQEFVHFVSSSDDVSDEDPNP